MSKLEDLWDELPTGKSPVDAIVAAGRADAARRRKLGRPSSPWVRQPLSSVRSWPAPQSATGPGRAPRRRTVTPGQPRSRPISSRRRAATSCSSRTATVHWGSSPRGGGNEAMSHTTPGVWRICRPHARLRGQRSQISSDTGTNVQETGVDEPDTVKTDGKLVVRLRGRDLVVYDASGSTMVKKSSISLPRLEDGEILLTGSTVVAIGTDATSPRDQLTGMRRGSRVITLSLAQPSEPKIESTVTYESRVVSARQHGATVRLVLAAGLPDLDFIQPRGKVTDRQALIANRRAVEESTIEDWLPAYNSGAGSQQLLDCTNVAVPPDSAGLDTVSVVGFTAKAPTKPHAIGLAAATTIAYESADHLYLADGPMAWDCRVCMREDRVRPGFAPQAGGTTHLYDFELDGIDAIHVASGEVEGTIADRWSLDEADDVLRVAVGPSSETGNFTSVVTFRREGKQLAEIGRLDGLGRDEDLKGVRWFDDLAVLVTYREVDPLFTIDLANPDKPRLVGKLKIPGYSDYLHPLSDREMLGIGHDGVSGAQIALFDTSDLAHVSRTAVETFPGAEAVATWEPRAFTWLPGRDTALTVLQKDRQVQVVALKVTRGHLSSTRANVEYGDDAGQVRTLGLPDGRVVLVTGEDVRFFRLP